MYMKTYLKEEVRLGREGLGTSDCPQPPIEQNPQIRIPTSSLPNLLTATAADQGGERALNDFLLTLWWRI